MDRNSDHGEEVVNVAVMIQRVMAERYATLTSGTLTGYILFVLIVVRSWISKDA